MGPKPGTKATRGSTRPKPSSKKQPLPIEEKLKRLFSSLCAQIEGGHLKNAIKTCDKILRLTPSDKDALQTKLYLLLQMDQYPQALAIVEMEQEAHTFEYEKAYSLYRLQREAEARAVLEHMKASNTGNNRNINHLEAQLDYRLGDYQAALNLYSELLDTAIPDSEEQSDIQTNLEAAQKHLHFIQKGFLTPIHDILQHSSKTPLEDLPLPAVPSATLNSSSQTKVAEVPLLPAQPKTPRKSRIPKHVILGVTPPPDPERWLKKSERTQKTQGGKKRKGGGGGYGVGATQGAVVGGATAPLVKTSKKKR